MEQQRPARGAERQAAKFVEDDEVGIGKPSGDLAWLALALFLFEGVDEFDGREEPDALAVMLDGLDADGRGEMRLARPRPADKTALWASSRNSQRCSWRTSASLTSLLAKSKLARSR